VFKRYLLTIKYLIRDVTILASIQNCVSRIFQRSLQDWEMYWVD